MDVAENLEPPGPILELGARAAEGQEDALDLRALFGINATDAEPITYIGADLFDGPGVDQIEDIHALSFADNSIGTVLCLETLEHVRDPLQAVREIHRVLKPGGLCVLSSVMLFPIHAHPWDYWRFTPEGFRLLMAPFPAPLVMAHGWDQLPEGVFAVGIKDRNDPIRADQLPRLSAACEGWGKYHPVDFGPIRMTLAELWRHTVRYTRAEATARLRRSRG
jgi:SAM-dependent methyltransferase